ncbi:alanine--tRNA ligase, mitochondrial [Lates japonicus]
MGCRTCCTLWRTWSWRGGYVVHQVTAADSLKTGDQVHLHLDQVHRLSCMVKHTATHILNFALRSVLGPSVRQRGSHISADRLRFDFTVKESLSVSQLQQVERCVNDVVSANQVVHVQELPLHRARTIRGLRMVDEVYPDPVRVVSVEVPVSELLDQDTDRQTSVELCCGTHLLQTGAIGDLVIVSERQLMKGISRIVAVTGQDAAQAREAGQVLSQDVDSLAARLAGSAPSSLDSAQRLAKEAGVLSDAVDNTPLPQWQRRELQARLRALQRSSNTAVRKLETREAAGKAQALLEKNGRKQLLVDAVETDSLSVVMKTVNQLSSSSPLSHVMLLAHQRHSGKVLCACQVPKDSLSLPASDWAVAVCRHLGGTAGGSVLVAKGTGHSSDITEALRWAEEFARQKTQR